MKETEGRKKGRKGGWLERARIIWRVTAQWVCCRWKGGRGEEGGEGVIDCVVIVWKSRRRFWTPVVYLACYLVDITMWIWFYDALLDVITLMFPSLMGEEELPREGADKRPLCSMWQYPLIRFFRGAGTVVTADMPYISLGQLV